MKKFTDECTADVHRPITIAHLELIIVVGIRWIFMIDHRK